MLDTQMIFDIDDKSEKAPEAVLVAINDQDNSVKFTFRSTARKRINCLGTTL